MFIERIRTRLLGSTTLGLVAVLALGGTVAALTASDFTYQTTKTGYLSIHPMALSADRDNADYIVSFIPGSLTTSTNACFSTGVNLPQGSRITQLAVWYSSPTEGDTSVFLQRITLATGFLSPLLVSEDIPIGSTGRKLAIFPIAGGSSLVSNIGFAYGFGVCPGTDGDFHGARIAYTYTSAGD